MLSIYKEKRKKLPPIEIFPDGREICRRETKEGARIYRERTDEMARRQGLKCAICHLWKDLWFDHEAGRGSGGGHRTDAILDRKGEWINAALCYECNSEKGSKRFKWENGLYREVKRVREVA